MDRDDRPASERRGLLRPESGARHDPPRPGRHPGGGRATAISPPPAGFSRPRCGARCSRSAFSASSASSRGAHFMQEGETPEQAGERILSGELISCSTPHQFEGEVDWFINPTFNQYKEWTWQLSRHPEWGILAERYRATGDERFAEAFVRYFESWVRQALVPENADGGATLCWRTIEAGIRMGGVWQWALHSFYRSPHFTDDVLVDWYKSVWEHGWRLRNFHRTGNWLIMEMNGLAQIGILYPQFSDAPAWKAYAFDAHGGRAGCAGLPGRLAGRAVDRLSPGGHQQLPVADRRVQGLRRADPGRVPRQRWSACTPSTC